MWGEIRKVPITCVLEYRLRESKDADERARIAATIEARKADQRFTVEIKHIGSEDDPMAWGRLNAEEATVRHKARVRARRAVEADGEPISEAAVSSAMARDPQWEMDFGKIMRAWIVAGVVGGDVEALRLFRLGDAVGGAGGGSSLWIEAATEVKRWQTVTADEGKG